MLSLGETLVRVLPSWVLTSVIYSTFIPSKEASAYNQAQMWFAGVISSFVHLQLGQLGGYNLCTEAVFGGDIQMNSPLMLFLPPAECKNPNPRWSELTDLHQLQHCSAGVLAGRA